MSGLLLLLLLNFNNVRHVVKSWEEYNSRHDNTGNINRNNLLFEIIIPVIAIGIMHIDTKITFGGAGSSAAPPTHSLCRQNNSPELLSPYCNP